MFKNILILAALLSAFNILQAKSNPRIDTAKHHSILLAKMDIGRKQIKFLLRGGIVSTHVKGQEVFEEKFGITYADFGCIMPVNLSIADYNKTIASYLDQRYGKSWRKEVRKDVIGI